jgi:hypothetical protein
MKSAWQHVKEKAADELGHFELHNLTFHDTAAAIPFPTEPDVTVIKDWLAGRS